LNLAFDSDFGVPIPGRILPPDEWARTALKRLPPPGPLDWEALFGRAAPVVLDLGCGNGRFIITSALARPDVDHLGVDILPLVLRYATRRANQRGLANVRLAAIGGFELSGGRRNGGSSVQTSEAMSWGCSAWHGEQDGYGHEA
jgi:tRNA (guanine-N7-)-methyltransferase